MPWFACVTVPHVRMPVQNTFCAVSRNAGTLRFDLSCGDNLGHCPYASFPATKLVSVCSWRCWQRLCRWHCLAVSFCGRGDMGRVGWCSCLQPSVPACWAALLCSCLLAPWCQVRAPKSCSIIFTRTRIQSDGASSMVQLIHIQCMELCPVEE